MRPKPGEAESGDKAVVTAIPDGALVAAIDGLGHGPDAAEAADVAVEAVKRAAGLDLAALVDLCHDELRATRGAALAIASFDWVHRAMTWLGVGNVEGRLLRPAGGVPTQAGFLITRGGVAGHELPGVSPATVPIRDGDLLILTTDGIGEAFADTPATSGSCEEIAGRILRDHARPSDDALAFVARYRESPR